MILKVIFLLFSKLIYLLKEIFNLLPGGFKPGCQFLSASLSSTCFPDSRASLQGSILPGRKGDMRGLVIP